MPELPEVETVRRTLEPLLIGKCIESFDLLWPRTLAADDPGEFRNRIEGRTISGVNRRGKLLVLRLDSGDWITIHLRMTGELLFHPAGATPRAQGREPYLRAALGFAGGDELLFYDTRKFGRITFYRHNETEELDRALGRLREHAVHGSSRCCSTSA